MRGDVVFRVYALHEGRAEMSFGAFRSRVEAEAKVAELEAKTMHGTSWARRYHNRGFVIREHVVTIDFEMPSRPKPRDKYVVRATPKSNGPDVWDSAAVEVFRRVGTGDLERVCGYERNYSLLQTFEPFRQGTRELALVSRDYTRTAVLDLSSGEVTRPASRTGRWKVRLVLLPSSPSRGMAARLVSASRWSSTSISTAEGWMKTSMSTS